MRSGCSPPHSGSLSVLPTVLGFPVHTCSPQILSGALWLLWALGVWGCTGNADHASGFAFSPRRPQESGRRRAWPVSGCARPAWSSPRPASLPFTGVFCSVQSLLHVVALFFPFPCLTLPLWIFSVTAVKVREREGGPGSWEGLDCVANPRSHTSPFWSLSPPGPSRRCPASGPGCHGSSQVQGKSGFHSRRSLSPSSLAAFPSRTCPLPVRTLSLFRHFTLTSGSLSTPSCHHFLSVPMAHLSPRSWPPSTPSPSCLCLTRPLHSL